MRPELRINLAVGEKKFIKHYLCVCCVEGFELNRNYKDVICSFSTHSTVGMGLGIRANKDT